MIEHKQIERTRVRKNIEAYLYRILAQEMRTARRLARVETRLVKLAHALGVNVKERFVHKR